MLRLRPHFPVDIMGMGWHDSGSAEDGCRHRYFHREAIGTESNGTGQQHDTEMKWAGTAAVAAAGAFSTRAPHIV